MRTGRLDLRLAGVALLASTLLAGAAPILLLPACRRKEAPALSRQACWEAKGGAPKSVADCEPMLPEREYEGVWVSAFEEASFMRGPPVIPSADDPRRYNVGIELDEERVRRSLRLKPFDNEGDAIFLRFVGRRMRDPMWVDCNGQIGLTYVVDRLIEVRYLGAVDGRPQRAWFYMIPAKGDPVAYPGTPALAS